jgi:hypothetical protein
MSNNVAHRWLRMAAGAAAFALAACSQAPTNFISAGGQRNFEDGQVAQGAAGQHLAVTHAFTLRLPSIDVEAMQQKHLDECAKLGCTVLNTSLDRSIQGRVNARTSLRIAPDAYTAFAAIIAAPPAEVVTHSRSVEDKTIAVLDGDKRLEVKNTLRDRLAAMLHDPGTKSAADLAAIEKELAQVQGDIETVTAERDYLRTITETVRVDISYSGLAAQAGGIDLSPIRYAASGMGQTAVGSVAALISFAAAIVPWLPLIAIAIWGVRRGLRAWRARKAPA